MPVGSGSYTIGAGGGYDYAQLWQAISDIGTLTGDLTFTVKTDLTETIHAGRSVLTLNSTEYTLTITSDSDPGGDPDGGHIISVDHNTNTGFQLMVSPSAGHETNCTIVIEKLNFKRVMPKQWAPFFMLAPQNDSSLHRVQAKHYVRNNVFNLNDQEGLAVTHTMFGTGDYPCEAEFYTYNNLIVNQTATGATFYVQGGNKPNDKGQFEVEISNNTTYCPSGNSGVYWLNPSANAVGTILVRDNVVISPLASGARTLYNGTAAGITYTWLRNTTSSSSAEDPLATIHDADEGDFVSVDPTSVDFLRPRWSFWRSDVAPYVANDIQGESYGGKSYPGCKVGLNAAFKPHSVGAGVGTGIQTGIAGT